MPPNLGWSVWSADFTSPTISQWNLSVQRQLGRSWVVTTAYVGSSSRHLQRLFNINAAGPGDGATERERRMIPSLGAITIAESSGSGTYHGLETTVEKRLSRGLQGSLSYTWSHSIDDVTEQSGAEGNMVIQDWRNIEGDRGNSGFDRRHRLVAHALVDLPLGAGRRRPGGGRSHQRAAPRLADIGDHLDAVGRLVRCDDSRSGESPGRDAWYRRLAA